MRVFPILERHHRTQRLSAVEDRVARVVALTRAAIFPAGNAGRFSFKRESALVPSDVIACRSLVLVIAIMTFLAALAAGSVVVVADASSAWQGSVSSEVTIQVQPQPGRNLDGDVADAAAIAKAAPGVRAVLPYSKEESEKLLEPWLGSGLDLDALPIPRLLVVKLDPDHPADPVSLSRDLAAKVPGATLDDHGVWLSRLATMADATVWIGFALLALVVAAMLLAVSFATRGAMAGAQEVIEVLHYIGGADSFISGQFQQHFLRLGLRGGLIGGSLAIAFFFLGGRMLAYWRLSAGGEQVAALVGTFNLPLSGYLAIATIAVAAGFLTGLMSRLIVYRHLRTLL